MLEIFSIFLVVTAALAYLNQRFIGLPITIGVMASALILSLILIGLSHIGIAAYLHAYEKSLLRSIDFSKILMEGMLSLLLFAGALHVDLHDLRNYRWQIGTFAVIGTICSTLLIGTTIYFVLPWIDLSTPFIYCMLFGALISPTDPIAVMGILKSTHAPKNLSLVIAGESLFNDGVGVVIFSLLLGMLATGETPTASEGFLLLLREAGGGLLFGATLGYITYRLLHSIDQYQVEVLITLAAVMGGYSLARHLHISGPLAMVVCGLMIGNQGRAHAMSDKTRQHVDLFWELLNEILNAVLFVLIGMEIILIHFTWHITTAALIAIVITLLTRWLTIGLPVGLLHKSMQLPHGSGRILTWAGLRGGISVALALALPFGPGRETIIAMTYGVVVFSILCQGLTVGKVVKHVIR